MKTRVRPDAGYARAHYAARRSIAGSACQLCGSTGKIEAALRPETPAERLVLDPRTKSLYSFDTCDYFPLCVPCHRRLDHVELRTHCKHGHEYTPENTAIRADNSRLCRTCNRDRVRQRLTDPKNREVKNAADRERRRRNPQTPEQKARKVALQRLRRQRG